MAERRKTGSLPLVGKGRDPSRKRGKKSQSPGPGRPPGYIQKRLAKGRAKVFEARRKLMESAADAADVLIRATRGKLKGSDAKTQESAADRILKKVGLGDTLKIESAPPVIVNLGGMPQYPEPEAIDPEDEDAE